MSDMIPAYSKITGKKRRIPPHWLDLFSDRFRKTPLSAKQEAALGKVDADKVTAKAEADAQARLLANRVGVLPQVPGAVGADTAGGDADNTDSTDGDNTNDPATGATNEGES